MGQTPAEEATNEHYTEEASGNAVNNLLAAPPTKLADGVQGQDVVGAGGECGDGGIREIGRDDGK